MSPEELSNSAVDSNSVQISAMLAAFEVSEGSGNTYADTSSLRYALQLLRSTNDPRASDVLWDLLLFDLRTQNGHESRFRPLFPQRTGESRPYPDLDTDFPDACLEYFGKRAIDKDVNHSHRAIYNDFLWEKKWKGRQPIQQAREAIEAYFGMSASARIRGEWEQALDAACRVVELSARLNQADNIRRSAELLLQLLTDLETSTERLRDYVLIMV